MRSVYMLAVLYAVTLEAAQGLRAFACPPPAGEGGGGAGHGESRRD